MTEIPEHLLARSKARRAVDAGGSAAPATTGDAAPAKAAAAAAPATAAAAVPEPVKEVPKLPWVEAAGRRRKIPVWAVSALVALPVWAVAYATTNDPQSPKASGPVTIGAEQYSACAACHGAAGGGGVGPAMSGGAVVEAFPDPASHVRWVMLGTAGYQAEGTATYGANAKPVGGGGVMPAQIDALTTDELLAVVRHERADFGAEEFDAAAWEESLATLENDPNPAVAGKYEEMKTVLEEWAALPPGV